MSESIRLPRLFIGSSTEGLDIAFAIQENLERDAETTVWSQGLFRPSQNTLHELVAALDRFDFASFVFSPDDVIRIRGREHLTARDNVIFELGLFFGALGLSRCFFVVPRDSDAMHLPTDLLAITPLTYAARRSDDNLVAALGSACNQVRRAFRATGFKRMTAQDYIAAWQEADLMKARENIRELTLDHHSDEFQAVRADLRRVYSFLEGMSDSVLAGAISEEQAKLAFEKVILSFWPMAVTMLAPPNHVDDYWNPAPQISRLYERWANRAGNST
jgi:hypothetical protein